jgi:hypothetical protein
MAEDRTSVCPEPGARPKIIVFAFGVVLLFGGAYLTYVSGYVPYEDALRGAPTVTLNAKSLMVGSLSAWLGLVLLASLLVPALKPGEDPAWRKVLGIIVLIGLVLTAVAGAVAYFWLRAFLKSRGYDV